MARGPATMLTGQPGEVQLSQLRGVSRTECLHLAPAERDVVRVLGPAALESVRDFGARCEGDREVVAAVTRHSALLHPEVIPWLARDMADYLIAYHTLSNALEGAVSPSLFGALPRTTGALLSMGRSLLRYSPTELRSVVASESCDTFGAIGKLGAGPQSLWTVLSYGTIEAFNACQRRAYHGRLAIQPGGDRILTSCAEGEAARHADTLAKVMTMATLSGLRAYSVHDLRYLRQIGQQQLGKRYVALTVQELASSPVYALSSSTGRQLELPPALVDSFVQLHHESWLVMHESVVSRAMESQSSKLHQEYLRTLGHQKGEVFYCNLSRLSVLTLPRELALLPDTVYQQIEQLCDGAQRSVEILVISGSEQQIRNRDAVPDTAIELLEPEVSSLGVQVRLLNPHQAGTVSDFLRRAYRELLDEDCKALEPIFTSSDAFVDSGAAYLHLGSLSEKLRRVAECRQKIERSLASEVMSSSFLERNEYEVLTAPARKIGDLRDMVSPGWVETFKRAFGEKERFIAEVLNYREELGVGVFNSPHHRTDTIATLDTTTYQELRRLVAQHRRDPKSPEFADRGGVVFDTYDRASLERYLADGNHLLVHRAGDGATARIDGVFLFGRAGYVPNEIDDSVTHILRDMSIPGASVSVVDIMLLDKDRTPGANQRLFVRHILTASLEGAQYNVGFAYEANAKHLRLLEASGAVVLRAAKSSVEAGELRALLLTLPVVVDFDGYRVPGRSTRNS